MSRLRNGLALLLLAFAAMVASRVHAADFDGNGNAAGSAPALVIAKG
jgi:hypothetical protein